MIARNETITKRSDGRYMGRFIIDHKENGKPVYQYVYGKTYEEAERKLLIARQIESQYLSDKSHSIKSAYNEWMIATQNRVKESTYANYRYKFEKHLLPVFGDMLCTEINSSVVNSFIRKKIDEGLSAGYIHDLITVFKCFLNYVQEEYSLRLSLKNISLPKSEKKKSHKMSDEQQNNLVSYVVSHMDMTGLGVLISLFMGLRIGELCGLKWMDIDLENKILRINRTVQRIYKENDISKTTVVITPPKSSTSRRSIPIPDFLVPFLTAFKGADNDYILSGSEKAVEPRVMQYRFKRILEKANVDRINYHKLRSTFATNCIENGYDAKTLSCVLGHSTVNITLDKYVHPDYKHEREMVNSQSQRMLCQSVSD